MVSSKLPGKKKSFDKTQHSFMVERTLNKLGIQEKFLNLIKDSYKNKIKQKNSAANITLYGEIEKAQLNSHTHSFKYNKHSKIFVVTLINQTREN